LICAGLIVPSAKTDAHVWPLPPLRAAPDRLADVAPCPELPIPLDDLPPATRDTIRLVLAQPTLAVQGPTEIFCGNPEFYHWLLDHPDVAVRLWRKLGAKCLDITDRGQGRYGWSDGRGGDIHWVTVHRAPGLRVWYAEGRASPGPMLPMVPIKSVAVLHVAESVDSAGRTILQHQANVYVHTDSKAVAAVAKLLGASAPALARQGVSQLEMFFSALVWYCETHPDKAAALAAEMPASSRKTEELRRLLVPSAN
jgi:hypothetical protein